MTPTQLTYPQFAPNQVLSNTSLNDLFAYLDDQNRLTRTNLIGIGVACGLEASFGEGENGFGILISPGVGVTSEGYLAHWDEDEVLEFYAPYEAPENIDYPFFNDPDGESSYPLWELTPGRANNPAAEQLTQAFLSEQGSEKALLLLVECKVLDNKNCAPNNCDDKGNTVVTTLRPILIAVSDLDDIRRRLIEGNPGAAEYYGLFANRAGRLSLPTLRAPRYDVTRTNLISTRDVFRAYQRMLSASFLSRVQNTLDDTYAMLAALLPNYSSNPFASRLTRLSFLHNGRMMRDESALAYQYYYDHLMTIIQAYQELRDRAESIFSLCCPDGRIFPRHLALHNFSGNEILTDVRHDWVSSPVQNQQSEARDELRSLFDRLVVLLSDSELPEPPPRFSIVGSFATPLAVASGGSVASLGNASALAGSTASARGSDAATMATSIAAASTKRNLVASARYAEGDFGALRQPTSLLNNALFNTSLNSGFFTAYQPSFLLNAALLNNFAFLRPRLKPIRITPTFWGKPLSQKAIPYHYDPRLLLNVWDYAKTRVGRADQNLGFDASQWNTTDDFVVSPLNYDLEPHDFLRIEGAVGQPYVAVLQELNQQIRTNRLPIDVVALRTGSLTDTLEIEDYELHFSDLDALYCSLRERMLGHLAGIAARLYDMKITGGEVGQDVFVNSGTPTLELLQRIDGYQFAEETVGASYEEKINRPFFFLNTGIFNWGFAFLFFDFFSLNQEIHGLLDKIVLLSNNLPEDLREVNWESLRNLLDDHDDYFRGKWRTYSARLEGVLDRLDEADSQQNTHEFVAQLQAVISHVENVLTGGDAAELEKIIRLAAERRETVLKRQLLSGFQEEHPGLQFKAGAPLGGTWILLYHGDRVEDVPTRTGRFQIYGEITQSGDAVGGARISASRTRTVISRANGNFLITVNQLPVQLTIVHEQQQIQIWVTNTEEILEIDLNDPDVFDADRPIPGIEEGMVIADFFLPYRCCGKGAPIHIFPPETDVPPATTLEVLGTQVTCSKQETEGLHFADVQLRISGGTPPYSLEDTGGNGGTTVIDNQVVNLASNIAYQVKDSQGQVKTLNMQLTLPISVSIDRDFRCVEDNQFVERTFRIAGGKPPYTVVDEEGTEQTIGTVGVGTVRIPSGKSSFIEVWDTYGPDCEESWDIGLVLCQDNGQCELPCDGLARIGSHPAFLEPPSSGLTYGSLTIQWNRILVGGKELTRENLAQLNKEIVVVLNNYRPLKDADYTKAMDEVLETTQRGIDGFLGSSFNLPPEEPLLDLALENKEIFLIGIEHFDCMGYNMSGVLSYELMKADTVAERVSGKFEYNEKGAVVNDRQSAVIDPRSKNRCEEDGRVTNLTKPSDRPKGTVSARKQPDGGHLLTLRRIDEKSEIRWVLPQGVKAENTTEGLRLALPEGVKKMEVKLLISDPRTGAFIVRKKTIKA